MKVRREVLEDLIEKAEGDNDELLHLIKLHMDELSPKHITVDDILSSINYVIALANGVGSIDDIDHLGNRRLRCVGEL